MTTRSDRERQQKTNERNKDVLAVILAREENKYCADCHAKGPRWASWNLGVLICIRCSGIHRSLGVHISKVKSVNLDTWTTQQMVQFCSRGNGWAREYYEARMPSDFKRPQNDSSIEYFMRDKYEKKKYICQKEVPLRSISDLGLVDNNTTQSQKKPTTKPRTREPVNSQIKLRETSNPSIPRPKSSSKLSQIQQQQQPMKSNVPLQTNNTQDLLGLNSPTTVATATNNKPSSDLTEDLFGPMSSYDDGLTTQAPVVNSSSNADLLNGISTETNVQSETQESSKKMSKDSILSLYSKTTPPVVNPMQMNNANAGYGVPQSQMHAQQYQQPTNNFYQNPRPQQINPQQYGMQNGMNPQQQQMMAMQQQQQQQQRMMQMQQQMHGMQLQQQPNMMMNGYSMPTMQAANPATYGMPHQNMQMAYQMPVQNQQVPPTNQMWGLQTGATNGGQTLSTKLWK